MLGSTPERGAARAEALGVPRAYASLEALLDDPTVDVGPRHLAQRPPPAAGARPILAAGKHVICEKPLAMSAAESRELVALAAATGLVNAANFNIRYYPLNQHAHEFVTVGRARRRPAGHRPLLPGLAAARHRLELAPPARTRRRAPGGRRHRLALARPDDLRHRPADRLGHGRARDVRRRPAASRPGRSRRSRPRSPPTRSPATIATEDAASILLRFENGARGAVSISQISAGRKNSLQYEIDGSERVGRLGLRAARPDVDRPSRAAERDPASGTRR